MRILLLTNLFPPDYDGGYEISAWKAANGLRGRGHEVDVVTSRFRPGFEGRRNDPPWVHRILSNRPQLPPPTWKMPWVRLPMVYRLMHHESVAWVNVPRLRRFMRGRSYDLAYIYGLHDVGLGCAYVPQALGVPVLWHFGDHYLADHQGRYAISSLFRAVGNTVLRTVRIREESIRIRHAAFISRFLEEYFVDRGVRPDHSYLIPRGIEFPLNDDVGRARAEPPVFLLASRLSKDKGIHVALEAARELAARSPELRWTMQIAGAGDEAYEASLRDAASDPVLKGRVEFLGRLPRERVLDLMTSATAFISASVWPEPFGNTIIEALAVGTPLIASDAGAIMEMVEPGKSALVYPRNSPSDLAGHMERVLLETGLANSLAERGLQRIREAYAFEAILDTTERVMKECLAQDTQVVAPQA